GVLDVLVQRVPHAEPPLEPRELAMGIALEADEEEAGVQLPRLRVGSVRVRVAAPEDTNTAVLRRSGEPDVRVERDHRRAVGVAGAQVDGVVLARARERRPADLAAADHALLIF